MCYPDELFIDENLKRACSNNLEKEAVYYGSKGGDALSKLRNIMNI